MSNLSPVEFEQLKSLISRRTLSTGEQTITLDILRSKFPNFFSNLGLTEANLKDDKFLIKYLTESHNRNKIIEALKKELSLSPNQLVELIEALETKPVVAEEVGGEVSGQGVSGQQEVPVSTTTGTSAGGMPGMSSFPSFSPARRRIYRIPHAPEPPKPEIHIANASGVVTEPGEPSKLVTTSGGAVKETPPSKIFIANSSGAVTGEHPIMPASAPKLPSRKKGGKRWFGRLRSSASSNLLDFLPVDKMASWLYKNAIKPLAQWLGRNVLQPLARLAAQTASRVLWPLVQRLALGALQGLLSMLGGLSGISLGGVAVGLVAAIPWVIAISIGVFFVAALWTSFEGFEGFKSPPRPLDYTLPLRSTVGNDPISPRNIKSLILESWPDAKLIDNETDNWQKIIDAAVANNWNPALLLTLWIEASGAQGQIGYLDPLGCKPTPQVTRNINDSLACFFNKFGDYPKKLGPDIYFSAFLRAWIRDFDPDSQNPQNPELISEIKYWYSQMVPAGEVGAITPITTPTGPTLDYKIPFRDTTVSVSPANVDIATNIIKISWPNAKLANWNTIVSQSIAANWNPAFVLALWIEESGAQGAANYSDALGCAPHQPTDDINISLKCLFDNFSKFQANQFQQFMETYSGGPADNPFGNNPNFPFNIKSWYATLIPAGFHGAIEPVAPPAGATGISGCPVTGIITNPYGYNLPDYPYKNLGCSDTQNNCHNGIDIDVAVGTNIKSPMKGIATRGYDGLKGNFITIRESEVASNPFEVIITFDHLSAFAEKFNASSSITVDKGDIIGKTGNTGESTGPHLHYQINKGPNKPQNPLVYLKGAATINPDVLAEKLDLTDNNYAQIRYQPGSITNNWGHCDTPPQP